MKKLFAILIVLGSGNLQAAEDVPQGLIRRSSSSSAIPGGGFSIHHELMKCDNGKQQLDSQAELTRVKIASTHDEDDGGKLALALLAKNKDFFEDTRLRDDLSDSSDDGVEILDDKPLVFTGDHPVYCGGAAALVDKAVFYIVGGKLQRQAALYGSPVGEVAKYRAENEKVNPKAFSPVKEEIAPFRSQGNTPVLSSRFKMVKSKFI